MAMIFLLVFQGALAAAGFFYLWRRQQRLTAEIAELRRGLAAVEVRGAVSKRARSAAAAADATVATPAPSSAWDRAVRAWGLAPSQTGEARGLSLPPATSRGLALGVLAAAPGLGFVFSIDPGLLVAAGLGIAAAMMFAALKPSWRAAAWAGVLTAAGWALLGFVLAAAQSEPTGYALCISFAGAAGLVHARLRPAAQGATLALAMCAAALALGSQVGMVGPAGAAFFALVALAAAVGASSLRLEAIHLSAFGASLIGLFVLSGQTEAAIWFTPVAAMTGALFFAIAAVRVPVLGAAGAALAGVGVLAPLGVIAALHDAQHGLSDALAAGGTFAALAAASLGVLALSARHSAEGLAGLKLTAWMLGLGALLAAACAALIALPAALAATALAVVSLGFIGADTRWPARVWRACAALAVALALCAAWQAAGLVLREMAGLSATMRIAFGGALPALLFGAAAFLAQRNATARTAAILEAGALVLGLGAAHVLIRAIATGGAPIINPVSFVEAGAHISVWLAAALLLGWRADHGASGLRRAAVVTLGVGALGASALCSFLWLSPYWDERTPTEPALSLLGVNGAGFLLPAALLWAHWALWRARGVDLHTRVSLGGAAMMTAAFATYQALHVEGAPAWLGPAAALVSFALAVGINFASGVTAPAPKRSDLEEKLD
ncbi:MAG: hypothetical protein R3C16_02435 [Hyphomonadaceae bacterium]